jgi:hypothetical protein
MHVVVVVVVVVVIVDSVRPYDQTSITEIWYLQRHCIFKTVSFVS